MVFASNQLTVAIGLSMIWLVATGCKIEETPALASTSTAEQQNSAPSTEGTERAHGSGEVDIEGRMQKLESSYAAIAEKLEQLIKEQKALGDSVKQLRDQGESALNEAKTAKELLIGNIEAERLKYDRNVALGAELLNRGEYEAAVHYFSQAIEVHPNGYVAFVNRGAALQHLRRWREALVDFTVARELEPDNYVPWNNAAWLLATCPDDQVRGGKEAFSFATKAGELTDWKDAGVLSTLAAAHAERGEFDAALNRIKEAIELAPKEAHPDLLEQQTQFEARKPIRMDTDNEEK